MGIPQRPSSAPPDDVSQTRVMARVGEHLGSRWVLLGGVAALLISAGVFSTASSYVTLKEAGQRRADAWLAGRRDQLELTFGQAFGVADPLLDQLAATVRGGLGADPVEALVPRLHALAAGRTGVTWISVSLPNGTFVGVARDEDGGYHAEASALVSRGTTPPGDTTRRGVAEEWVLTLDDEARVHAGPRTATDYDPRRRPFYRLAVRERQRAWTEPYTFLPHWHTGVTRTEPVYGPGPQRPLLAVLTVDFDAVELARLLGEPLVPGQRTLVLTSEGVVLASRGTPDDTSARVAPPSSEAQPPPTLRDLGDPLSVAIREAFRDGVVREARVMEVTGQPYRYDAQQVLDLSGQRVWLVTAVPERELYADAQRQALTGAATTGALTLVALLGALAVSSSLANHRRKRLRAERAARRAEEQVRQLGRYELLEPLGAGAMGEVYRARHTLLARDAALKLIKHREPSGEADTARDAERRQRFFDEAQRLASLHCLHTVAVHDFGVAEDGRYYLVMELLDGLDLATLVERDGPQPAARVAHILAQVCASLAEAHDAGLVHQDVKPANVFLCRIADALDFVKVLDFGLARAVGEQGAPGEAPIIEGTPAFMAPEQVVGEAITPAVDLYGLGGLGFFLLTGKPPYQGANRHALFAQHVHGPLPTWPEHSVEHTPAALRELLLSCLAKRPAERPPSARVLGEQLARLATELEGEFDPEARVRWWAAYGHRGRAPGGAPPESMSVRLDILRSVRRRLAGR